jgi:serine protease AprX
MKKYLMLSSIISATLMGTYLTNASDPNEIAAEYILQGAQQQTIIENVNKVGGEVVFSHSVIQAVSVKLTNSQILSLKEVNPMIRLFKDQKIEVSRRRSRSRWFLPLITKQEEAPVIPETIPESIAAPIIPETIAAPSDETSSASSLIDISTISSASFFSSILNVSNYITVETDDGTSTLASELLDPDSLVVTNLEANLATFGINIDLGSVFGMFKTHVDSSEVSWIVSNSSDTDKSISELFVSFPNANGLLGTVSINGKNSTFSIGDQNQLILDTPILLKAGIHGNIRVGFDSLSTVAIEAYSLKLGYDDGSQENILVANNSTDQGQDRDTYYSKLINADDAHEAGITGAGVTVAILDTGMANFEALNYTSTGANRAVTFVDILGNNPSVSDAVLSDDNGHGTHLASIIANSTSSYGSDGQLNGGYNGVAPDVNLVVIKAFDEQGFSSYLSILQSLEYIIENKDVLDIKVLNLSFSTSPSSLYWDDPINQALMRAWDAGITVIASAGNTGPDAMSIGVPGNTPHLITVGATSDNYTPHDPNDDFVASFSSAGPTYEGYIKPELVAPGARIQGLMSEDSYIRQQYALYEDADSIKYDYFELSGTSQSTAVMTGVVALMLQADPYLTPNDIKCRLIATARAATNNTGELAYSIFQQGAGLVDAMAAINSSESGCANVGLSIQNELDNDEHYFGPVQQTVENGEYYIPGLEALSWSGEYVYAHSWINNQVDSDSQLWRRSSFNSDSQLWRHSSFESNSQLWRHSSFETNSQLWRHSSFETDSQLWRHSSFETDSQLWRHSSFETNSVDSNSSNGISSSSIQNKWVDHE